MSHNIISTNVGPSANISVNKSNDSITNQRTKRNGFTVFCEMCAAEYAKQFPEEQISETEFQKKCSSRWKDMTKKEKASFDSLSKSK